MEKISLTFMIEDKDFPAFAKKHSIFARTEDNAVVVGFEMHDEEEIHEKEIEALRK